jgi:hypothetical protein
MRLITHNMLKCNIKSVNNGYPLVIEVNATEEIPTPFDIGIILFFIFLTIHNFYL